MTSTVFARAAFVALIAATLLAFFISQRVKSTPAVIEVRRLPAEFYSPNADGHRSKNKLAFRLKSPDQATVVVTNAYGDVVRRLATDRPMQPYRSLPLKWDGRNDSGSLAPDGKYFVRINLREQRRSVTMPGVINLTTTPPTPKVVKVTPDLIGSRSRRVTAQVEGINPRRPTHFRVVRTDVTPPREVANRKAPAGSTELTWNARTNGHPASPGTYMFVVSVQDRAGNTGTTPAHIPPRPGEMKGHAGLTIRRLAVQPPLRPVVAGKLASFFVDSRKRRFQWSVRRIGTRGVVKQGVAAPGKPLRVRAPGDNAGVYLLDVRAGSDDTTVPFMVQGPRRSGLLIVLPAVSWVGSNPVDDEPRDGVPNMLSNGSAVDSARPLTGPLGSGLPRGFKSEIAPLLSYFDRASINYDLTSDLALSTDSRTSKSPTAGLTADAEDVAAISGGDPSANDGTPSSNEQRGLTDYQGVILLGPFRWITNSLGTDLRHYVDQGGRVASFGTKTLRAGVTIDKDKFSHPTPISDTDAFGFKLVNPHSSATSPSGNVKHEAARDEGRHDNADLLTLRDTASFPLLAGTDGVLSGFSRIEESRRSPGSSLCSILSR